MAYSYLASAFVGMALTRFRHRGGRGQLSETSPPAASSGPLARDSSAR
jgi:hypothetical protein